MKKFLCILLAAVLMLSISVSAFAGNIDTGIQLPGGLIGDNSFITNPGNNNNNNNNNIFVPVSSVASSNITIPGNSNSGSSDAAIPAPAEDPVVVILNGEKEENPNTGALVLVPAVVALAAVTGIMASKRK